MRLRNNPVRWGVIAKTLHWLMALGILFNGGWGWYLASHRLAMGPMRAIKLMALHKSIGLTLLALLLLRVLWRFIEAPPRDLPAPRWQVRAAHALHLLLYALIAAILLSGWWLNSLRGFPLQWFRRFNLPALASKNDHWADIALAMHNYGFWLLLLLLAGHVGAALKHHIVHRDDTLRRMWPFARLRALPADEGSTL